MKLCVILVALLAFNNSYAGKVLSFYADAPNQREDNTSFTRSEIKHWSAYYSVDNISTGVLYKRWEQIGFSFAVDRDYMAWWETDMTPFCIKVTVTDLEGRESDYNLNEVCYNSVPNAPGLTCQ